MNSLVPNALKATILRASACSGNAGPSSFAAQGALDVVAAHKLGPGPIVTTADGGQVYGYDVDWNDTDGILASAKTSRLWCESPSIRQRAPAG
jgi:hypothetical protein